VDRETFAGGQVIEQLTQQVEVSTIAFFVGLADVLGVADQAPEHHPGTQQFRVHDSRRKRPDQERIHLLRRCPSLVDFVEQGSGELAGELLVGVGDQRIDAAEMVIEQANGHSGLGSDAPHGNPGVAIANQTAQGRFNQQFAAFVGIGTAVFRGEGGHKEFLGVVPRWRA